MAIKRKLILSIFMLALTIVTLSSTTYAWFVKNREAWTDEFNMQIENTEGLLMSIDGVNFSQDISKEQIVQAIEQKMDTEYDSILLSGVSLKHDEQKIMYDATNNPQFVKDSLLPISGTDRFTHTYVDATKREYIGFDLYFKVITTGEEHAQYRLKIQDSSYIAAEEQTIVLNNRLSTQTSSYNAGDSITVNPKDAMRIGFTYVDEQIYKTNVYEPNLGLGSAAIEASDLDIHNKDMNAMYTYYNNTHPLSKFTAAATAGEGFQTLDTFSIGEYGEFNYNADTQEYNTIALSVSIWLEGWDADYFMGLSVSDIKVKLGFTLEKNE